jgi:hypothetical protein
VLSSPLLRVGQGGQEGLGEVVGGFAAVMMESDQRGDAPWGGGECEQQRGESKVAIWVEETVEIEWQILMGSVRDDADDGEGESACACDFAESGGLHIDGIGAGLESEGGRWRGRGAARCSGTCRI